MTIEKQRRSGLDETVLLKTQSFEDRKARLDNEKQNIHAQNAVDWAIGKPFQSEGGPMGGNPGASDRGTPSIFSQVKDLLHRHTETTSARSRMSSWRRRLASTEKKHLQDSDGPKTLETFFAFLGSSR